MNIDILVSAAVGIIVGIMVFRVVFSLFPDTHKVLPGVDYTTRKHQLGFNRWQY